MKKAMLQVRGTITGPKASKEYNGKPYHRYPVVLEGGWTDNVLCEDYDDFKVNEKVDMIAQVTPDNKDGVKMSLWIKR